jgi:hypothetical protein
LLAQNSLFIHRALETGEILLGEVNQLRVIRGVFQVPTRKKLQRGRIDRVSPSDCCSTSSASRRTLLS